MKNNKSEPIPVMDYRQYRRVRRLVHECCNYIDGNCIALDDGEECVCVQSISYSLLCRWFRAAVLPQDKELETALFHRLNKAHRFSKRKHRLERYGHEVSASLSGRNLRAYQ